MTFNVNINIMPKKALLDPQGKAVKNALSTLDLKVEDVRIGKSINITIKAETKKIALSKIENACKKLLINQITEEYSYQITEQD
ncbi:MAG: phosphoribosylformylglycinamidine synthase [Flavobacteriales bacterium TMED113]|nr:MAG: phosphoribosylformylglycinamidine synthase [Flavobacteriales bacterium TMED113]